MTASDDEFIARRLEQLQRDRAIDARKVLNDGVELRLSSRQVGYLLGRLAGLEDSDAIELRKLLDPSFDPLEGLYDSLEEPSEEAVCAGQEADVTKHVFWYGSSSRNRPRHHLLFGLVRALVRGSSR